MIQICEGMVLIKCRLTFSQFYHCFSIVYRYYLCAIDCSGGQPLPGPALVCICPVQSLLDGRALEIGPGLSGENNHVVHNNNSKPWFETPEASPGKEICPHILTSGILSLGFLGLE